MAYTSDRLWGVIGQLMENLRSEKDSEAHKVLLHTILILFLFLMLLSKCEPALLNTPPCHLIIDLPFTPQAQAKECCPTNSQSQSRDHSRSPTPWINWHHLLYGLCNGQ